MNERDRHVEVRRWWREHGDSVARHLFALTGQPELVEDLVVETFIRAFEAFETFEGRSSTKTWLHGIALNVARNELAKGRRRAARPAPPPRAPAPSPEDEVRRRQAIRRFYAALDGLEPGLREIFVMRVIEQRKLEEISERLAMPVSTVHGPRSGSPRRGPGSGRDRGPGR